MRRVVVVALVAAAGCGEVTQLEAGPTDRFYFPTGVAVTAGGSLLVASSNFDLRYEDETGGSVIAVDPTAAAASVLGAINVQSFGGQLALADPAAPLDACPVRDPAAGAVALLPIRGANLLYRLRVSPAGAVSCAGCAIPMGGATRVDPYGVGVACGGGLARAYVGYLRSTGRAEVTQVDLTLDPSEDGAVQHFASGLLDGGQARGFAFDAARGRLYVVHTVTREPMSLRWVDVGGRVPCAADPAQLCPCRVDREFVDGGCATGTSVSGAVPNGLELRGIALSRSGVPFRRAYLTARVHDAAAAAAAGYRVGDFDGKLLVADLVETLGGRVDLEVVNEIDLGYGAGDVVVLPPNGARRDVVAALAADSGRLTIYDDETGEVTSIGADLVRPDGAGQPTGAPLLGHVPTGLAVAPVVVGDVARLYVASFRDGWVTPVRVDVPLGAPASACLVTPEGACVTDPWLAHRIGPAVAP